MGGKITSMNADGAVPTVTREQALAHRFRVQGLDRAAKAADARELDIWALGLQDSPAGSAALALAARLRGGLASVPDLTDARRFVTAWGTRGAPLVMRTADVRAFAEGLWPIDAVDAVSRLSGNGQQLRKGGEDPIEAIRVTAAAMHDVVAEAKRPMTKGEMSTEVSTRLPEGYITWCRGCQAHHLGDQLMRVAGLPAGLRLVPDASPATLTPIARWKALPANPGGADRIVRSYLHLYGPATPGEVGAFLLTTAKVVKTVWPEDLAEVSLDGKAAWLPAEDLDALVTGAPFDPADPDGVRVLPRSDPWLLARDRERTVSGAAHRKALWPVIGWPGAVLAGGEVIGSWRAKAGKAGKSGKSGKAVVVTVEAFETFPPAIRRAVEGGAADVAAQRGDTDLTVTFA